MSEQPLQLTTEQREILAEIGHFYLLLESHQAATKYCHEHLQALRAQLEQSGSLISPA